MSTENQYLLADRKTKLFPLTATLVMTELNTGTLIAFSSAGFDARWWALTLPSVFLIGLLFYAVTVAKKWKEFNGISVAHYFSARYGHDVGILVAIILFVSMAGFSAAYIKSFTLIFSAVFPQMNPWQLSGLLTTAILFMTWRGGLIAIIRTDIISFLIVVIFFPLLLFFVYRLPSPTADHQISFLQMQQALPTKLIISLILLTMFSYILAPWYGQKVISAESPRVAIQAIVLAAVLVFIFYGIGVLAVSVLGEKGVILTNSEQALPYIIKQVMPVGWQGIGYFVLFLIAVTTLSGVWSAMVTLLIGKIPQSHVTRLNRGLTFTVFCAFLSYTLSNLFIDHILNKIILANVPVVALSFALLGGFYWPSANRVGVYVSIIVGLIWGFGCYLKYGDVGLYTWYWALYGIPLIFFSGLMGSLCQRLFVFHNDSPNQLSSSTQ
ncbi:sodium:solute symporter family protein [Legionella pneumophila]|uniref:sodium:solute symporter family protein n=1 Tax=Legionella pneumophila TaxID=446 RepID=UPI001A283CE7|nr:hypothetical protein [Legionella pneumophila]HAT1860704.1 hypothetical protein [Legionella pneumophila]HAU2155536.1 hypothetical protein [Legionella pneumophila]